MTYSYRHPRPALAADVVLLALQEDELELLLIRRGGNPFSGSWALPGGFVNMDETLDQAALRELAEETGLTARPPELIGIFDAIGRDPRERVVSAAYLVLARPGAPPARAASDAREVAWHPARGLPNLAFDHDEIVRAGLERLRQKALCQPIGLGWLPSTFSLGQLQRLYELVLDAPLDKRNFRRRVRTLRVLCEAPVRRTSGLGRPARLYRFDRSRYRRLQQQLVSLVR